MYRQTKRAKQQRERAAAMGRKSQQVQAEKRLSNDPCSIWEPPKIRRVITITDYDIEEVTHTMELRRSNRIDCYDCYINGELWKSKIGWSRVLEWVRKAFPRIHIFEH